MHYTENINERIDKTNDLEQILGSVLSLEEAMYKYM